MLQVEVRVIERETEEETRREGGQERTEPA